MSDALFVRSGEAFEPAELAQGPWAAGFLHGGPVLGLLAHGAEAHRPGGDFVAARLTVDLHHAVPMAPLELAASVVRRSRRMGLVDVAMRADGREVARASALFLRTSDAPEQAPVAGAGPPPRGPHGLATTSVVPKGTSPGVPPGFHREVEVRWSGATGTSAAWLRMPMTLVEGAACTPFERVAALADLGNAVASMARLGDGAPHVPYINPDVSVALEREPGSEWIAFATTVLSETRGVGLVETAMWDEQGPIGRAFSARLYNPGK